MGTLSTSINIGDLKKVIEIQRLQDSVADEYGFIQEGYVTICKTRCKTDFDDRLMREILANGGVEGTIVKIFTFRYFKGLTERDVIVYEGDKYEIYGINDINDEHRFLKVWGRKICQ